MRPKFPSFRSSLLRMHEAILEINENLYPINLTPRLSKLEIMVILLEDRRFLEHKGIDFRSIAREVWRLLKRDRHGGASTIDMQLFRTVSDRYERTLRRKLREFFGVALLQRKFNKIEILRVYLRVAYMGTGVTGSLEAAHALYPDKVDSYAWELDEAALSLLEVARIAALLVYPKPRIANANWEAKVSRRANYGLALYSRREKQLDKVLR